MKRNHALSPTADPLAAFFYSQPLFFQNSCMAVALSHSPASFQTFHARFRSSSISATDTSVPHACVKVHYHQFFFSLPYIYQSLIQLSHNIRRQAHRLLLCQESFLLFLSWKLAQEVTYSPIHTEAKQLAASEVNLVVQRQGSASSRILSIASSVHERAR
jgi:hypothetical protein